MSQDFCTAMHGADSMGHDVKNDVDAERVGPLLRELLKEIRILALALPAVAIVHVVCRNDHDAAFVIGERADMHVFALLVTAILARVNLPGNTTVVLALFPGPVVGSLQAVFGAFQVEHTMENRVLHRQLDKLAFGQNALDFVMKNFPLPLAPKVVRHEHPAIQQIPFQNGTSSSLNSKLPGSTM